MSRRRRAIRKSAKPRAIAAEGRIQDCECQHCRHCPSQVIFVPYIAPAVTPYVPQYPSWWYPGPNITIWSTGTGINTTVPTFTA